MDLLARLEKIKFKISEIHAVATSALSSLEIVVEYPQIKRSDLPQLYNKKEELKELVDFNGL